MNKFNELIEKELIKLNENEGRVLNLDDNTEYKRVNVSEKVQLKVDKAVTSAISGGAALVKFTGRLNKLKRETVKSLYILEEYKTIDNLRIFDLRAKEIAEKGSSFTHKQGAILGALGIGIPDIPIFITVILQGMYSICTVYGFDYKDEFERKYILTLLKASLARGKYRKIYFEELDNLEKGDNDINTEDLSRVISSELLAAKLVQGILLVGAIGGLTNRKTYNKIMKCTRYKYRQRFLRDLL